MASVFVFIPELQYQFCGAISRFVKEFGKFRKLTNEYPQVNTFLLLTLSYPHNHSNNKF